MITENKLSDLLAAHESFRVERTTSTTGTAKFSEAVCAFANDMPGSRRPGFLLIGADDKTGAPTGGPRPSPRPAKAVPQPPATRPGSAQSRCLT